MKTSNNLQHKIKKAKEIIQQAFDKYGKNLAVAWTGGKDSTIILHMIKSMYGHVPFPVLFNDSTMEFEEIYDFIEEIATLWNLDLHTVEHLPKDLDSFYKTDVFKEKKLMIRQMKINTINWVLENYDYKGFIVGIRHDEHPSRSKEKPFSKRQSHIRIHPILQFTEKDVWQYIKKYKVPYVSLYDQGYRSLGEKPFTSISKDSQEERSGREQEKEKLMEQLRKLGYW